MLHALAYGNSDQASFRDPLIRKTFDILTVPSTIASYYPEATAAFVLSSGLEYMIEPRTPLFQELLPEPRASHYTLALLMGSAVSERLGVSGSASFPSAFYTQEVCDQVVISMINFQRDYGGKGKVIADKLNRYRQLLEDATGKEQQRTWSDENRSPSIVLCPYFAARSTAEPWWSVMERIWHAAIEIDDPGDVSAVVAVSDVPALGKAILQVPEEMSSRVFYWSPGFDERRVTLERLLAMKEMVAAVPSDTSLINLYGGYYSILLGKLGLAGLNSGLGYSESRDWPALDATGAAPPRYYVRNLHAFVSRAIARQLVELDSEFECDCAVCQPAGDRSSRLPDSLDYHELKKHFALARAHELWMCESLELSDLCNLMRDDVERIRRLRPMLPGGLRIPVDHLSRWVAALDP